MNLIKISLVLQIIPTSESTALPALTSLGMGPEPVKQTIEPATPPAPARVIINSPDIYKPIGPYSHAILAGKMLYVSGVLGKDINSQLVCGGAEGQTRQALMNLKHVLEAGGGSLTSVVKTTILLGDMADMKIVNEVYAEFFPKYAPARATFQVGKLPVNALVEIEAIALSGNLEIAIAGPCPCAR